jgi:cytochrome d ubiquinol oxidase subunit I
MAIHSTIACYMSVGFAVAGWYAWRALRGERTERTRSALVVAMIVGSVAAVLQPLSGDLLAKYVFRIQPVKFAAMEGQFKTQTRAPLRIGGWPDEETQTTRWAIEIPGGLSFLATRDFNAEVPGLDRVPRDEWPPVDLTHMAFQIMVGSGMALLMLSLWFWTTYWRRGNTLLDRRALMRATAIATPLGFIGLEAGWFVTEVGRQPWVIQGVMRTRDALTPAAGVPMMFWAFAVLYTVLGITVIVLLRRLALRT